MSELSGDYYSRLGPIRPLSKAEHAIVTKLVCHTTRAAKLLAQLRHVQVCDMPDGGMGSIHFCSGSSAPKRRNPGEQIAEGAFTDADGTPVSITLDLDDRGKLYELDVFKAD